jgi:hypothetical protein
MRISFFPWNTAWARWDLTRKNFSTKPNRCIDVKIVVGFNNCHNVLIYPLGVATLGSYKVRVT